MKARRLDEDNEQTLYMKSQAGGTVISRCIYKSGTTSPARLSSLTSHCITASSQSWQLARAPLMYAPRKAGGRPEETARHFPPILCAAVPGLRDAVLLDFLSPRSPFHTEHTPTCNQSVRVCAHTYTHTPRAEFLKTAAKWPLPRRL